jgi:hypothetical protein
MGFDHSRAAELDIRVGADVKRLLGRQRSK